MTALPVWMFCRITFFRPQSQQTVRNVSELFTIASVLNIDMTDIDSEEIFSELEVSIASKEFNTLKMKNSLAWAWAHAETEEQKQEIRDQIAEHMRINY